MTGLQQWTLRLSWMVVLFFARSAVSESTTTLVGSKSELNPERQLSSSNRAMEEIDIEECAEGLVVSDEDTDLKVDETEYVDLIHLLGPKDFLTGVEEFEDLPLLLQSNFHVLACLCKDFGGDEDCCVGDNAHLDIKGTSPDATPEDESLIVLQCLLTAQTLSRYSAAPTVSPAPSIPTTESPTSSPVLSTSIPTVEPVDDRGLSGGGIAGVVLGGALLLSLAALVFGSSRKEEKDEEAPGGLKPTKTDSNEEAENQDDDLESGDQPVNVRVRTLLTSNTSRADGGSMGTMESDELLTGGAVPLVDLGEGDQEFNPSVTNFEDLEAAINRGDWAAVGASAAILASKEYDSASFSRSSKSGLTSGTNKSKDKDAERASELDMLIDAGDWEGVISAAAKFEAEVNAENRSVGSSSGSKSVSKGSTTLPSMTSSIGESTTKKRSVQEIREEVTTLVKRVVPEEIDNVDEMMKQFKGREDELLETLRTMRERDIAQKARKASQVQAKLKVKGKQKKGKGMTNEEAIKKLDEPMKLDLDDDGDI